MSEHSILPNEMFENRTEGQCRSDDTTDLSVASTDSTENSSDEHDEYVGEEGG